MPTSIGGKEGRPSALVASPRGPSLIVEKEYPYKSPQHSALVRHVGSTALKGIFLVLELTHCVSL